MIFLLFIQLDALGEVVSEVNGRVEVYLDGGIRSGLDVLKAVGLGARAVFCGRPLLWGLAHNVSIFLLTLFLPSNYSTLHFLLEE